MEYKFLVMTASITSLATTLYIYVTVININIFVPKINISLLNIKIKLNNDTNLKNN